MTTRSFRPTSPIGQPGEKSFELAPVFQPLCGGGSIQVPTESKGTLSISGDLDWRGKTVWRTGVAPVRLSFSSTDYLI